MKTRQFVRLCFSLSLAFATLVQADDDILIADFEGEDYGQWKATGEAFGSKPARGTLPGQMGVSGYEGRGLVNTFLDRDRSTGTLTSPEFEVERDYVVFLIGGGAHDNTCLQLLVDDKVVARISGMEDEHLALSFFDVREYRGNQVKLRIVDENKGGWGHVNVDQIRQSDTRPKVPQRLGPQSQNLQLTKRYLLFPIKSGVKKSAIDLSIDGRNVREFDAEIATSKNDISFWSFVDVAEFQGKAATLTVRGATKEGLAMIAQADEIPGAEEFYDEALRPQFHFSQKLGWNNDPNGMVYYDGEWHLYFQHNPYGWNWGNMHWGHAVSKDLVHWEQLPIAIYNKRRGDWAFSGGAVVDENNTTGWQTGKEKVIVASWTSTGRGECLAYSNDRGRTFTEYEGNPVIKHGGRDPKIIWYEPGKHWVLVVYDESKETGRAIAFYTSQDMKTWQLQSKLKGYFECAELFELPVDDDKENTRWVVFAADARYAIGSFDGKTFTPDHEGKHQVHYGAYYASQTFSNSPGGRRIQIGWARIAMPGMPFNQTFSFPHRLTLRTTSDGIRMFAEPVKEIEALHHKEHRVASATLAESKTVDLKVSGDIFDIRATFEVGNATAVGLDIGGERITYDLGTKTLNGAPMALVDGKVSMQVLVDRPMLEICGNHGRVFITAPRRIKGGVSKIQAFATGGEATLSSLDAFELKSIWK